MFTLRKEQVDVLHTAALRDFEDRMVVHLNEFFPEQCSGLGEPGAREAICYGLQRAASYGLSAEDGGCKYIDLMFAFGRDFDRDPKHPWARRILNDPAQTDPGRKADRLYETALANLRHAAGVTESEA